MLSPAEVIFWLSFVIGLYPYAGYPLCIALLKALAPRPVRAAPITPSVSIAIAAYNEAMHIEATVRNKLEQDYPTGLVEVLVASDGSTDGTDEVLARIAAQDSRVSFVRQEPRGGKTLALNRLLERARGEVVVFADANSMYRPDCVRRLVAPFADPAVGYVTGQMRYVDSQGSLVGDGCTAYMRYENALRASESAAGSVVGVDGAVDAVRRSLYVPMRPDQQSDFVLPLAVVEQGYRVVYAPNAVQHEETLTSAPAEYRMRVRVTLGALWALWDKRALLNPLRFPLFSWQLVSHKLLRYLSFLPLGVAALTNWVLFSRSWVYAALAVGQVGVVLLAVLALRGSRQLRAFAPARYCFYFLLLNCASAVALWRFLRGEQQVVWQPRTG